MVIVRQVWSYNSWFVSDRSTENTDRQRLFVQRMDLDQNSIRYLLVFCPEESDIRLFRYFFN